MMILGKRSATASGLNGGPSALALASILYVAQIEHASAQAADPDQTYNVHGQTTFIQQSNLRFNSPYEGENSLKGAGDSRETLTVTPSVGLRLWQGGEVYFN